MIESGYRLPPPSGCPRTIYQIMMDCWCDIDLSTSVSLFFCLSHYIVCCRHPETSGRPSFASLVSRLSQPENQLLKWTDRDKSIAHPQSTMLGAPLETASELYTNLQHLYLDWFDCCCCCQYDKMCLTFNVSALCFCSTWVLSAVSVEYILCT